MKTFINFIILFFFCYSTAQSKTLKLLNFPKNNQTEYKIPFKLDRHLIIIAGYLGTENPKKYDFIFDSGTSGVYLLDSLAKVYNYAEKGKVKEISPEGIDMGYATLVKLNALSFENLAVACDATLMPKEKLFSPTAIGIVGLSAFNGYVITIDYTNKQLVCTKGKIKKAKNLLTLNKSDILETTILVGNKSIPAHFDCGSPMFISIPKAISEKNNFKYKTEPKLVGRARTVGGEMDILLGQFDGNIAIGNVMLNEPRVEIVTANFPAINIGYRFFVQYNVSIDFKNKRMKIEPK